MSNARALRRQTTGLVLKGACLLSAVLPTLLLIGLLWMVIQKGWSAINWEFLTTKPSYLRGTLGVLPNILNTLYLLAATLVLVLPPGIGAAIYLNEYCPKGRIASLIEYAAETLAGIPSVIYGLAGMLIFSTRIGTSLASGALTMAMMTLPLVLRSAQESLRRVPNELREASYALGGGKLVTLRRVILPCCVDGIATGCVLAAARVVGESAALLYTAGLANTLAGPMKALGQPGSTLTVSLYVYAKERGRFDVAFAIGLLLILLTVVLNGLVTAIRHRAERRVK